MSSVRAGEESSSATGFKTAKCLTLTCFFSDKMELCVAAVFLSYFAPALGSAFGREMPDYESLRIGGMVFAVILFLMGIFLIVSQWELTQRQPETPVLMLHRWGSVCRMYSLGGVGGRCLAQDPHRIGQHAFYLPNARPGSFPYRIKGNTDRSAPLGGMKVHSPVETAGSQSACTSNRLVAELAVSLCR
ncbi:unnamed protein product [Leuciscus chuanchicus]